MVLGDACAPEIVGEREHIGILLRENRDIFVRHACRMLFLDIRTDSLELFSRGVAYNLFNLSSLAAHRAQSRAKRRVGYWRGSDEVVCRRENRRGRAVVLIERDDFCTSVFLFEREK